MLNRKNSLAFLAVFCLPPATLIAYKFIGTDPRNLDNILKSAGAWAPAVFIVLYAVATSLLLPATPLNLLAGALLGPWLGTLCTSAGALIGAAINFALSRSVGQAVMPGKVAERWPGLNAELRRGGVCYIFALRLLPLIPYGIVSYAAGLSPVRFRDYMVATVPGTVLGILPFVLIGSSGLHVFRTGRPLPLITALGLTGALVAGATWYRNHRVCERPSL